MKWHSEWWLQPPIPKSFSNRRALLWIAAWLVVISIGIAALRATVFSTPTFHPAAAHGSPIDRPASSLVLGVSDVPVPLVHDKVSSARKGEVIEGLLTEGLVDEYENPFGSPEAKVAITSWVALYANTARAVKAFDQLQTDVRCDRPIAAGYGRTALCLGTEEYPSAVDIPRSVIANGPAGITIVWRQDNVLACVIDQGPSASRDDLILYALKQSRKIRP